MFFFTVRALDGRVQMWKNWCEFWEVAVKRRGHDSLIWKEIYCSSSVCSLPCIESFIAIMFSYDYLQLISHLKNNTSHLSLWIIRRPLKRCFTDGLFGTALIVRSISSEFRRTFQSLSLGQTRSTYWWGSSARPDWLAAVSAGEGGRGMKGDKKRGGKEMQVFALAPSHLSVPGH